MSLENGETLCSNCHSEHHRTNFGVASVEKRAAKKAKIAMLKAENSALKHEIAAMRAERHAELVDRAELARLKAALAEYEQAYEKMTVWDGA